MAHVEVPEDITIEAGWRAFAKTKGVERMPPMIQAEIRRWFYAGACWHSRCLSELAGVERSEESGVFGIAMLKMELQEFGEKMQRGDA